MGDDLIQASTVLLLRDSDSGGEVEVLMVKRNSKIAFGGLWVFPGGRVDSHELEGNDTQTAALLAGVREVDEETSLQLQVEDLVPWSHWVPPEAPDIPDSIGAHKRRYATWFFAAPAPEGIVTIDDGEIKDHQWVNPAKALEKREAGEIELVPPTWVTLFQIAEYSSVAEVMDVARANECEHFETKVFAGTKPVAMVWHGDAGYLSGDPTIDGARHRLTMDPAGWRYERT